MRCWGIIRGVLLDLAGVLYDGGQSIEGSVAALARLKAAGLPLRFVTNSTRTPRRVLLRKLESMGFEIAPEQLFTPARAACDQLRQTGRTPHLLIHPDLAEDFADLPTGGSDLSVVVADAAEHFTFDAMNAAFRALMEGADLLALAHNRSFRDADGQLSIDVGAFVTALEYASGQTAHVLGKPAPAFFSAALDSMGVTGPESVMIGDDAEADVAGALTAGLGGAVLVQTGKYRAGDERRADPPPTYVAANLADAVNWVLAQPTLLLE